MFTRLMFTLCLIVFVVGAVPLNRERQQNRGRGRSISRSTGRSFNSGQSNRQSFNRGRQLDQSYGGQQQQQGYGGGQGRQVDAGTAPANNGGGGMMPMNYDFQYAVDDEESQNYYGHKEAADNGRVDGVYYVWQPDGRLMKVEYYVDGDSGFVPTITFEDAYEPQFGTPFFQ